MEINKKHLFLAVGVAVGVVVVLWMARDKVYRYFDYKTSVLLYSLDRRFREKVAKMLHRARKKGIELRVISAYRGCGEQNKLYAQGRSLPGKIVTNARCGQSAHNYGLAVDVVEFKNGKPLWDNPNWETIGRIGEGLGLEWGGRWSGFVDKPHFQDLGGHTIASLYQKYLQTGKLEA